MKNGAAYLFPGQGTSYKGFALDFLGTESPGAKTLFALASEVFGRNMEALLRDGDEQTLKRTDVAQAAITLCGLVAAEFLGERNLEPKACAGFSLGEYPAMSCAGVISAEDCFRLIKARGEAMQQAVDNIREAGGGDDSAAPGMSAVLGLEAEKTEALIGKLQADGLKNLYAANINSPTQLVVSGTAAALNEAEPHFKAAGAKVMRLRVAGPFHSPLMADAAEAFRPALEAAEFADPKIPLYSNVTGKRITSGAEAKELALLHIVSPVRWLGEQAAIAGAAAALGFGACLEVGPGKTLRGFWKDSTDGIPCHGAGTLEDVNKLCDDSEDI